MCRCKICNKPIEDCELSICLNCFLEMSADEVKDMAVGGRFYGEKPEKETKDD